MTNEKAELYSMTLAEREKSREVLWQYAKINALARAVLFAKRGRTLFLGMETGKVNCYS